MTATLSTADIPVISITADCLPEAWEKAVLAVWDKGFDVKTQYDKPEDPPSKDATVMITLKILLPSPGFTRISQAGRRSLSRTGRKLLRAFTTTGSILPPASGPIHITNGSFRIARLKISETLIRRSLSGT